MWVYLDLSGAIDLLSGWVGGRWLRAGTGRQCMGAGGVADAYGGRGGGLALVGQCPCAAQCNRCYICNIALSA